MKKDLVNTVSKKLGVKVRKISLTALNFNQVLQKHPTDTILVDLDELHRGGLENLADKYRNLGTILNWRHEVNPNVVFSASDPKFVPRAVLQQVAVQEAERQEN